jgi:hypothetical protein
MGWQRMGDLDRTTLLARLARLIAEDDAGLPLETRLCRAYLAIIGGDGAALTVAYTLPERVTLCTTDDVAARLEDLQDVLGEGPGPTAYVSEQIAAADLRSETGQWPLFTDAARKIPGASALYAVPMRPWNDGVIGVLTVHQNSIELPNAEQAQFLANAIGAALVKGPPVESDLRSGPWSARSHVHQATGMVVAQLRISPEDALALLRAHAFSHDTTLAAVAEQIIHRRLQFTDHAESDTP